MRDALSDEKRRGRWGKDCGNATGDQEEAVSRM